MHITAVIKYGQSLLGMHAMPNLTILILILHLQVSHNLPGQESVNSSHSIFDDWYTSAEKNKIRELTKPQMMNLSSASDLKQQLQELVKIQGLCLSEDFKFEPAGLEIKTDLPTNALPKIIELPSSQFPDKKLLFFSFVSLMEQQTQGRLKYRGDFIQFIDKQKLDPVAILTQQNLLTGDHHEIARLQSVLSQETKAANTLPGRISHRLTWQFEPRVKPLRMSWKTEENHWQINNIEMTALDIGATYERNVLDRNLMFQDLSYLLPDFSRSKVLDTKITGVTTCIIAWGDLQFDLDLNSISTESSHPKKIHERITLHEWKLQNSDRNSYVLDFEVDMPPVIKLNTADVGLVKPQMKLVVIPNPATKNGNKAPAKVNLPVICKLLQEDVNVLSNKIHWRYNVNPALAIETNKNLPPQYQLEISIPFYLTKNLWKYDISLPLPNIIP